MSHVWMPFYIGDYLRDTRKLNTVQHGAYVLLIMEYWLHRELPTDDRALARIALLTDREWKAVKAALEPLFLGGWKHKRVEEELAKADEKSARRAAAGSRGGESKSIRSASKANSIATSNASDLPEQCCSNDVAKDVANGVASSSQFTSSLRSEVERGSRSSPKRASRLAPDWHPSEADVAYARAKGFSDQDIQFEAEKIRNWSASNKNGAKLDWAAAWRNWILGATPRNGRGSVVQLARRRIPDV